MKLLDKTLLALLLTSIIAIGASTLVQYHLTKSEIEARVDRKLLKEKRLLREQLQDIQPEEGFSLNTERSSVRFLTNSELSCADSLYDGYKIDAEGEKIAFRILRTCIEMNSQVFRVEIKKENEETDTFIRSVFLTHLVILIVVIGIFVLFKFFFLKNTWKPFFVTLQKMKEYDIQNEKINFNEPTNIKEFKELNGELQALSDKVYREYQSQKNFVEDASHELMTPIAVIRNKVELLIQSDQLNEDDLELIADIFSTLDRLARINKSLILLSKIDQYDHEERETVSPIALVDEVLNYFEDQIRNQHLTIRKKIGADLKVKMSGDLGHILMLNLVKNAINHNIPNGSLTIETHNNAITLINTGKKPKVKTHELFKRFTTHSNNSDSIGLGLSIVQKIAQRYNIQVDYSFEAPHHTFTLTFPQGLVV